MRVAAAVVLAAVGLTACGAQHAQPRGGRFLVYTRNLGKKTQGVWIARTDGKHARLLVREAIYGAVSPNGRWVAYVKCLVSVLQCQGDDEPFALFVAPTSGGKSRLLARTVGYALWSPTSDLLLGVRRNALVTVDLDGHVHVVERTGTTDGWTFSPDGEWIAYAKARQHTKCGSDVFVVRADGGDERRLTHGRDIFPVWGPRWIAFSRYPKSCAYARRIFRIRPDGSAERPVTAPPPRRFARNGYYGFDPIDWAPDERTLLAGISSEWGPEAIAVDVATGNWRKLSGYALDLSRNGRFALVDSGGSEGPQALAIVDVATGRRHVFAKGDVAFPSWNR